MPELTRRAADIGLAMTALGLFSPQSRSVAAASPRFGGALTFGLFPEPTTLSALDNSFGTRVCTKVTEGLLQYDFDFNPQPQLATAWSISPDGLQYSFDLRRAVKWHDGRDFTSDDVAFSILTLKQVHPRRRSTFANVVEVRTPDPHRAIVVLSQPAPYLLASLAAGSAPIVPKHIYDGGNVSANPNNMHPIGTGPFLFKEWIRGSHIILERNPNYWDSAKPYLDRIVFRIILDAGARAAALETGEIDLSGDTPVSIPDLERLKTLPFLEIETHGYEASGNLQQIFFNLDSQYLRDLKVRQAIAHVIDLDVILKTIWYGYGKPSPTAISPALAQFHDPSIKAYAADLPLAQRLLDEAGYPLGAGGERFSLDIVYNPNNSKDFNSRLADYLKQALNKIGVRGNIRSYDFGSYVKTIYADRKFDIDVETFTNGFDPTDGVQRGYWSKSFKIGLGFSNASHYASPTADRLLEAAAVEADIARRIQLYKEFQRVVHDDLPSVNLIAFDSFTVSNKRVKNHTLTSDGLSANFAEVFIDR